MAVVSASSSSSQRTTVASFQPQNEELSSLDEQSKDDKEARTQRVMQGSAITVPALQTPLPRAVKVFTDISGIDARILSLLPRPEIVKFLTISQAAHALQKTIFQNHLQQLTRIKACDIPHYQTALALRSGNWEDVLRHCRHVRHLDCETYQKEEDLLLLPLFIRLLPYLTSISFRNLEALNETHLQAAFTTPSLKLQSIDFNGTQITDENIKKFASQWPSLRKIDLGNDSADPVVKLRHLARFCPRIRSLTLSFCNGLTDDTLEAISQLFPELEFLDISGNTLVSDTGVAFITDKCKKIISINLSGNFQITDHSLHLLAEGCTFLTEINLTGCSEIKDVGLQDLIKKRSLISLQLKECKRITEESLQLLPTYCPNLSFLNVESCMLITRTAISNLKQQLPQCDITFETPSYTGE